MQPVDIEGEFVTGREAAALLGVSEVTFHRKRRDGLVPEPALIWGQKRYRRADLLALGSLKRPRGRSPK